MSQITQPWVCYIHTAVPRVSYTLRCDVRFPQIKKKCATGDINPKSSHWNNGKMKIAYNSAYIQVETVNFTITLHAVIVYFSVPTSKKSLCRTPNISVQGDYFLPIISEYTLIASKKSIQPCTYSELLLLLVILVQTSVSQHDKR